MAVTERGVVTAEPRRFRFGRPGDGRTVLPWQPITAWAGPWPCDESWWTGGAGLGARFQFVGADGRAWLLVCGPDGWSLEAGYD